MTRHGAPIRARPTRPCRAAARPTTGGPTIAPVPCYWPYHKPRLRPRRRRLVARSGRRPRRAVAAGAHPHVLGRPAAVAAERAAVRAAPQRRARHAALRRVPLVGRRLLDVGDAEDARAGRRSTPACPVFRSGAPTSAASSRRRNTPASCTCAGSSSARSVRCSARTAAPGICGCRGAGTPARSGRSEVRGYTGGAASPIRQRAAQRRGRADRQEVPRAALPPAAVHLHGRARVLRDRPADDARAVAALSRRSARRSRAAISSSGDATSSCRRSSRRARRSRRLYLPRGAWFDFWTEERVDGGREIDRAGRSRDDAAVRARRRRSCRSGRSSSTSDEPVDGPLTLVVYPGRRRHASRCTKTTGGRSTIGRASGCACRSPGATPPAS